MIFLIFMALDISDEDNEKFLYIYEEYKNLLFTKAYDVLKDHMLAEDALSEAFIRIYKNLSKIDDASSGRCIAFCVTITRNAALTIYQKRKKESLNYLDEDIKDEVEMDEMVLDNIAASEIYEIVRSLDEDQKNIFILKYSYGMSHSEIAKSLGLSENNVTVKLHRTKKRLAQLLEKEGYLIE